MEPGIPHKSAAHGQTEPDPGLADDHADRELRAKYFDWCSARIAERFVNLSVQEIYSLADSASDHPDDDRSFRAVMERATAVLAAQTALPRFEEWVLAYHRNPAAYDADLIGFWKEHV